MDDRALVYRGADQPDMSVINPESDVWQHIKVKFIKTSYSTSDLMCVSRFPSTILQQIGPFSTRR